MQNPKYSNHFRFSSSNSLFYNKNSEYDELFYNEMKLLNEHKVYHKSPWTYINYTNKMTTCIWKIHISATVKNYESVLSIVSKYCDEQRLNFKFNLNFRCFILMNSKEVARVSAGKFITIYIENEDDLESHLTNISLNLRGYEGPYILTDLHYENNIYIRYGEYRPIDLMNDRGTFENYIVKNCNTLLKEERQPYFIQYDHINIPEFLKNKKIDSTSVLLSKYNIEDVLHFSSGGGVYVGYNRENKCKVIIKEARNYTGIDYNLTYFSERLIKEYFFLEKFSNKDIFPKAYELLEDHSNHYLIEEFITGITLKEYILKHNPLMRPNVYNQDYETYFKNIHKVMLQVKNIIQYIHSRKIVIGDLSFNNFIVNEETHKVTMIDLETLIEEHEYTLKEQVMITPGFNNTSKDLIENDENKYDVLIVASIFPLNNMLHYFGDKYSEILDILKSITKDYTDVTKIINLSFSNTLYKNTLGICMKKNLLINPDDIIRNICNSIIQQYSDEKNTYFPADPHVYNTNKYSVSHGLFGVIYSLVKINNKNIGFVNQVINDKLIYELYKAINIPKGLFMGYSGICWVLSDLGYKELGKSLFDEKVYNNIVNDNSLFYGNAGILIATIKMYLETNDKKYLKSAKNLAYHLIAYNDNSGSLLTGYGEGISGISLSLIYYYQLTKDSKILKTAIKYFDIEYRNMIKENDYVGIRRNFEEKNRVVNSPYIYDGISGVGMVAIRLLIITKNMKYLEIIKKIVYSCDYKITLFSGYMRGMSGIICFLTDVKKYCPDDKIVLKAEEIIKQLEKSMSLHIINEDNNIHFLGEQLYKASCDYSTGGAGIILQLFYRHNYGLMDNPNFLLDELL